jgi:hypothetical protein
MNAEVQRRALLVRLDLKKPCPGPLGVGDHRDVAEMSFTARGQTSASQLFGLAENIVGTLVP